MAENTEVTEVTNTSDIQVEPVKTKDFKELDSTTQEYVKSLRKEAEKANKRSKELEQELANLKSEKDTHSLSASQLKAELETVSKTAKSQEDYINNLLTNKIKNLPDKLKVLFEALPASLSAFDRLTWLESANTIFEPKLAPDIDAGKGVKADNKTPDPNLLKQSQLRFYKGSF